MENRQIVLTISLLASNRRESTMRCLDSLAPIRDAVASELIIVDTGCDSDLRQQLEMRADVVTDFVWCNDFSKARNAGLSLAKGEWFLYLDDDEWFVDCEEIVRFFRSGEYRSYGSADYIQRNFLDEDGSQYTDAWVGRMIRIEEDTHFASKIHERLLPVRGKTKPLRAIVHHFGYVYPDEETKRKHFERNRILLEEMLAEEPEEIRWKLQLLQEYRSVDEFDRMRSLGRKYLEEMKDKDSFADRIYVGTFYAAVILAEMGEAQYAKAKEMCKIARQDVRNTIWFETFLDFSMARSCFFLGQYQEAEFAAKKYLGHMKELQRDKQELQSLDSKGTPEERQSYEAVLFEERKAPFVGEALDIVKQKEIYSILICAGLKKQDTSNLQNYLSKLHWEERHVYVFEKMAECLMEAMCIMTGEECFAATLRLMYQNSALWNYFCEEVLQWEKVGHDIFKLTELMKKAVPEAFGQDTKAADSAGTAASLASDEFMDLAAQIKSQIRQLIANNLPEQALSVVLQIRTMLPEDEELIELERKLSADKRSETSDSVTQ